MEYLNNQPLQVRGDPSDEMTNFTEEEFAGRFPDEGSVIDPGSPGAVDVTCPGLMWSCRKDGQDYESVSDDLALLTKFYDQTATEATSPLARCSVGPARRQPDRLRDALAEGDRLIARLWPVPLHGADASVPEADPPLAEHPARILGIVVPFRRRSDLGRR